MSYFYERLLTNGKGKKKSIKKPFYVLFSPFNDVNIARVKYSVGKKLTLFTLYFSCLALILQRQMMYVLVNHAKRIYAECL